MGRKRTDTATSKLAKLRGHEDIAAKGKSLNDYNQRFKKFISALEKLSNKTGIAISSTGGVYDNFSGEKTSYSNDWTSGDIMPDGRKSRKSKDAPTNYYKFIDGLEKISNRYKVEVKVVGSISYNQSDVVYDTDSTSGDIRFESEDNMANGGSIDTELEKFDTDKLDAFERLQYMNFEKSVGKARALKVLINNVEGDYSQLSPKLRAIAKKYKMKDGGYMAEGGKTDSKNKYLLRYAQTPEQQDVLESIIPILDKNGIKLSYGTSIGKSPQTILFDLNYQDGILRINADGYQSKYPPEYDGEEFTNENDFEDIIENIKSEGFLSKGGHMAGAGVTASEKEIIKEYEKILTKQIESDIKRVNKSKDPELIDMYRKDQSDHQDVIDAMYKGHWSPAYSMWRRMDTASRDMITNDAYELLMKKNNLPNNEKGGYMADGGVSKKYKNDEWYLRNGSGEQVELNGIQYRLNVVASNEKGWADPQYLFTIIYKKDAVGKGSGDFFRDYNTMTEDEQKSVIEQLKASKYEDGGDMAGGGELETKEQNIKVYLSKFPDDAKSWAQSTEEVRDLARSAREHLEDLQDIKLEPVDFRAIKTPSEWNKKGKQFIFDAWGKMNDNTKRIYYQRWEGMFENEEMKSGGYMAKGGALEHGLRQGDCIKSIRKGYAIIENTDGYYVVNPENGARLFAGKDDNEVYDYIDMMESKKQKKWGGYAGGGALLKVKPSRMNPFPESGTSFKNIYIETTAEKLIDALGLPSREGTMDDKVQMSWIFEVDGKIVTLYDYKEDFDITSKSGTKKKIEWHVGGNNTEAAQKAAEIIKEKVGIKTEKPTYEELYEQVYGKKPDFKMEHGGETHRADKGAYMAKGGVTEHGLKSGDTIKSIYHGNIAIIENGGEEYAVDIENGKRKGLQEFTSELMDASAAAYKD